MEINLSTEMIEKITYVSAGRLSDLKAKEEAVKNSMAVGETQIRRKRMQLKDIKKAISEAKEVHALFLDLLEEVESKQNYCFIAVLKTEQRSIKRMENKNLSAFIIGKREVDIYEEYKSIRNAE